MSEVEKMYENAGVEPTHYDGCVLEDKYWNNEKLANQYSTFDEYLSFECPHHSEGCYSTCEYAYDKDCYPPFTAEKQLSLMAFLINRKVGLSFKAEQGEITVEAISRGLAGIVNRIWQDLTQLEQEQIRSILNG